MSTVSGVSKSGKRPAPVTTSTANSTLAGPIRLINYGGKFVFNDQKLTKLQVHNVFLKSHVQGRAFTVIVPDNATDVPETTMMPNTDISTGEMQYVPLSEYLKTQLTTPTLRKEFQRLWAEEYALAQENETESRATNTAAAVPAKASGRKKQKTTEAKAEPESTNKKTTAAMTDTSSDVAWENGPLAPPSPRKQSKAVSQEARQLRELQEFLDDHRGHLIIQEENGSDNRVIAYHITFKEPK